MISTTLCYIEKDNKYLMLHRNKREADLNAEKWIGVGGKLEEGETVEECLIREVFEETGLMLTSYIPVGMIKFESDTYENEDMYLFKGTAFEGELISDCDEGTLEWVDQNILLELPTWQGDRYFLEPLLEGRSNLNITVSYEGDTLVDVKDETAPVHIDRASNITSPHGFSTRIGGVSTDMFASLNLGMNRGDNRHRVTENWRRFFEEAGISERSFVCGNQVHGNLVHTASRLDARPSYGLGHINEADGYVTNERNLPLAIFMADCVPLLLEDDVNGVIGAVHSGWRSTAADIEGNAIEAMLKLGASKEHIKAAIGPAIDRCCFEVGREVIDGIIELIGADEAEGYYSIKPADKYMLDLRGVVACRLRQLGLTEENIQMVGECTMCHPKKYYSHRYSQGSRGSLAAVIMLKE